MLVREPWQLPALQPLNAWFFATVAGVGLTLFQEIFPSPGLASGLFTNTRRHRHGDSGRIAKVIGCALDSAP